MVRIGRAGLEFPGCVPLTRRIVFGMYQQAANPGDVCGLCGAQQRILEQGLAQVLALMRFLDGEPCQDHDRHRMACEPFHPSRRRGFRIDAADGETVEADHHATLAADVGLRGIGLLVDERVALQELVQRSLAAIESIDLIRSKQLASGRVSIGQSRTPGLRSNFFRRGLLCTGRSSASWKDCHCVSSSTNWRRSASVCAASVTPASSRNSLTFLWQARAASCSSCLTGVLARTSMRSVLERFRVLMVPLWTDLECPYCIRPDIVLTNSLWRQPSR